MFLEKSQRDHLEVRGPPHPVCGALHIVTTKFSGILQVLHIVSTNPGESCLESQVRCISGTKSTSKGHVKQEKISKRYAEDEAAARM